MVRGIAQNSRPIRSIVASLSFVAALLSVAPAALAEQGQHAPASQFHAPSTEAEQALDRILIMGDGDDSIYEFMTDRHGGRAANGNKFGKYFSSPLLDAISAFEHKLVKENCGGSYVKGDMCGFEASPLTCAQDVPPNGYKFLTAFSGKQPVISISWDYPGPAIAEYRMKKKRGTWVIDAIACAHGDSFNW